MRFSESPLDSLPIFAYRWMLRSLCLVFISWNKHCAFSLMFVALSSALWPIARLVDSSTQLCAMYRHDVTPEKAIFSLRLWLSSRQLGHTTTTPDKQTRTRADTTTSSLPPSPMTTADNNNNNNRVCSGNDNYFCFSFVMT